MLVTGTPGGIGQAIARRLAEDGFDLILHGRNTSVALEGFAAQISDQFGVRAVCESFDLTDSYQIRDACQRVSSSVGQLFGLVNNAGRAHGGFFQMTPMSTIREVFETNFFGQLELTQRLIRPMIKAGEGSIVNISSVSALDLAEGNVAYGCSKAALNAFTRTLAAEVGCHGVRVNAVAPGLTDTRMASLMEPNAEVRMVAQSAMARLAAPREIASVVGFLLSEASSFVNGEVIRVSGGRR